MKTYISISAEPEIRTVSDGKTGNKLIDEIIPKIYEKFSVSQLKITEKYKFDTGFLIVIKSHDNFQRDIWQDVVVEYQYYTHGKTPRHHYAISCDKCEYFSPGELFDDMRGYESTGSDFDKVLNDFFLGSTKVIDEKIKRIEKLRNVINKKIDGSSSRATSFHEILSI